MFVHFIDIYTNKPVERVLGIFKLTTSKKEEELHNVIMNLLQSKEINSVCLVHLIPRYRKLLELDGLLISLWKIFKYGTTKQAIFEESQEIFELSPTKILKACTTRWLTHEKPVLE